MDELVSYQNGKWIPNSKIGTHLYDAHYFFGVAVFDAWRTFNQEIFLLDEHIDRLYRSAKLACINPKMSKTEFRYRLLRVLQKNKPKFEEGNEYRIMTFISPGYFPIYSDMGKPEPIITINITSCKRYAPHIYPYQEDGVTGVIVSQIQIPHRYLDPKIKCCSRMHLWLANQEAGQYGDGTLPIMLDEHGFMVESTGANIVAIKDNDVYIPRLHDALRGCTLNHLAKILSNTYLQISTEDINPYDLLECDAIIFTGTFEGLMPCYNIIYKGKKYELNKERGKPIVEKILKEFNKSVKVNMQEQWKKWYEESKI